MKLRSQIVGLGLVGVLMTALVGGVGLINAARLSAAFEESIAMNLALSKSQEADMMHDAIRGDVLRSLFSAQKNDNAGLAEATKDLNEHADNFSKNIAEMQALPISDAVKTISAKTAPLVKAYIDSAAKVQSLAAKDAISAEAAIPEFQKAFKDLEVAMEQQGDAIAKDVEAYTEQTTTLASRSKILALVGVLITAALMTLAALWLAKRLSTPMSRAVVVADRIAEGGLASTIVPAGSDETIQLLEAMARMQTNFGNIVRTVQTNAESVATASAEIAQGNHDLSARTEQQASSLEETAASMEELGAQVKHNADNARQANQLAQSASTVAVQGGEVVAQVVDTMKGIVDSSRRIADIISVIDGIAFQTNILALNAAVEAARAGEQGRGFAVVASEVRSLAGRSAAAAREIKALIEDSVNKVENGSRLVADAGQTIAEVVAQVRHVNDLIAEITAASAEQTAGITQVGQAVNQLDTVTQKNAAMVEESMASAIRMGEQAQRLVDAVKVFAA